MSDPIEEVPLEGEVVTEPDKLEIIGKIVGGVASYGAGVIVSQIIQNNTMPKHIGQKVGIYIGGAALCGLAGYHAGKYAKQYTMDIIELVRNTNQMVEDIKEQLS